MWILPHIHGDMTQQIPGGLMPTEGTCIEKTEALRSVPLVQPQYCYTHGMECRTDGPDHMGDIDMSGLPCEENSRANVHRMFLNGRFKDLYATWARRHKHHKTRLVILENTEVP